MVLINEAASRLYLFLLIQNIDHKSYESIENSFDFIYQLDSSIKLANIYSSLEVIHILVTKVSNNHWIWHRIEWKETKINKEEIIISRE